MTETASAENAHKLNVSGIFLTSLSLFVKNTPFFLITSALAAPLLAIIMLQTTILMLFLSFGSSANDLAPDLLLMPALKLGLTYAVLFLIDTAIMSVTLHRLSGRPGIFSAVPRRTFQRYLPYAAVSVISSLAILTGLFFLAVPGIILFVLWTLATPVCVAERLGPIASLKRSAALTKGYRLYIFAMFLAVLLVFWGAAFGLAEGLKPFVTPETGVWIAVIREAVCHSFWVLFTVVVYYHVRLAKEGAGDPGTLVVFD